MQQIFRFPLKQHIGASSIPTVKQKEEITRGTLIAKKPKDILGCNIHSSVSGIVKTVTEEFIEIERNSDFNKNEYTKLEGNTTLDLIEEAGITGMGGAGFPTAAKLNVNLSEDGVVIINAVECEPILSHNIERIEKFPEQIYKGLLYAMEVTKAKKGIIAIKEKHDKVIEALKSQIHDSNISIKLLPDIYPMGEERAVIREALGVLLPVDSLPSSAGAVIINAETAARITEAVEDKKPFIDKDITVGGRLNNNEATVFFDIPLGIRVDELFKMAGGMSEDVGEIIMGGPFTGKSTKKDAPIIKTTGGLIAAMPFLKEKRNIGLLVCACGANEERLKEIAGKMEAPVSGIEYCKQAIKVKGSYKCSNPGKCPGQAEKVLKLRKNGAQTLLISNCTDCSNTVMSIAPSLHMPVYHCTDGALRAAGLPLVRKHKL